MVPLPLPSAASLQWVHACVSPLEYPPPHREGGWWLGCFHSSDMATTKSLGPHLRIGSVVRPLASQPPSPPVGSLETLQIARCIRFRGEFGICRNPWHLWMLFQFFITPQDHWLAANASWPRQVHLHLLDENLGDMLHSFLLPGRGIEGVPEVLDHDLVMERSN